MIELIQGLTFLTLSFGATLSAFAQTPAPCRLSDGTLFIEVRSEPDDGAWGPTIEIVISDQLRPLNRMIIPESRPIEACWWADMDRDVNLDTQDLSAAELVIGIGANDTAVSGVMVFDWAGHQLRRRSLPALPPQANGSFRYVVANGRLWAHPITARSESTAVAVPHRLNGNRWVTVEGNTNRSGGP